VSQPYTKTYVASGAIADRRIVRSHASNAGQMVQAAAATEALMGIANQPKGAATGERVDVVHGGEALVEAGAAFSAGVLLTADASGRAILAAPATGVNNRIIAVAIEAASAAGDLVRVFVTPCSLQG
jgi:hypothetical protein